MALILIAAQHVMHRYCDTIHVYAPKNYSRRNGMKYVRAILVLAVLASIAASAQADPIVPDGPSCNGSGSCNGGTASPN
jgi:hypothetical protein